MFDDLSLTAILSGLVSGFVAGLILSLAMVSIFFRRQPKSTGAEAGSVALSPSMIFGALIISLFTVLVAGFVAGHMASNGEIANSFAVVVLILVINAPLYKPAQMKKYPWWYNAWSLGLVVPFGLLGGWLALKLK